MNNLAGDAKKKLTEQYTKYSDLYTKILREESTAKFDENGDIIPINTNRIIETIRSFKLNKRKWLDSDIEQLPTIMAWIFALWSL